MNLLEFQIEIFYFIFHYALISVFLYDPSIFIHIHIIILLCCFIQVFFFFFSILFSSLLWQILRYYHITQYLTTYILKSGHYTSFLQMGCNHWLCSISSGNPILPQSFLTQNNSSILGNQAAEIDSSLNKHQITDIEMLQTRRFAFIQKTQLIIKDTIYGDEEVGGVDSSDMPKTSQYTTNCFLNTAIVILINRDHLVVWYQALILNCLNIIQDTQVEPLRLLFFNFLYRILRIKSTSLTLTELELFQPCYNLFVLKIRRLFNFEGFSSHLSRVLDANIFLIYPSLICHVQQYNNQNRMLNRRYQIQKYNKVLRTKHAKSLRDHMLLKHKIEVNNPHHQNLKIELQQQKSNQSDQDNMESEDQQSACWADDDAQEMKVDATKNKIRKLARTLKSPEQMNLNKYEKRLGKFYNERSKQVNWAQPAQYMQTVEEKDVQDYLNQQLFFGDKQIAKGKSKTIKFMAKTPKKHESIVTGMQWQNNILFTSGYDQKLLAHRFNYDESISEEKIKLQKEIYVKDLPLSKCYYHNGEVIMGSLRKNMVVIDTEKWKSKFITSNFLKEIKNYANLRIHKEQHSRKCALFENRTINILDKNNLFTGAMISNQEICDFSFSKFDPNYCYSATSEIIYEWDLRKMQVSGMLKQYLNFTTINETNSGNLILGSKLGGIYIYSIRSAFKNPTKIQPIQNNNILTHITNLSCNVSGEMMLALSKWKSNAARVISVDSGKALKDWPAPNTRVGYGMTSKWGTNNIQEWFSIGGANGLSQIYGLVQE